MPEPTKRKGAADDATERGSDAPAEAALDVSTDVLSKRALIERSLQPRPTEVLDGLRLRGLTAAEYHRMNAERVEGALEKGERGIADAQMRSDIAWLMAGVVEPKLARAEWMQVLAGSGPGDGLPAGQVEAWVTKIKELSGHEDMEVALTKKLLAQNLDGLRS